MSKKVKYSIEYPVRCSPTILYEFLSSSSGLQEWFADKVEDRDNGFDFSWSGSTQHASVLEKEENKFIRYQWEDSAKDEFFEFRIDKSEVTNQTILVVSDFADKSDLKDARQLWETQIKDLLYRIGS
ncbi:MAG TPA: START-like domain-containing protein [Ginsengibacter sp.]|nr:START-like domain-containing protein [Chitinophagaceae bacterium]HRN71876.1 START-like domain-containing protein [Ginsengibacter sp.]HRP17104.1 START-like domain-containing protein [Ginsengibacter sp.]HRP44129.1 START-like domain-containing protein [Ginsengibacter sp.]